MGWSQALFGRSGQRGGTADVPPDVVPELDSGAWVSTWGWAQGERLSERQDGPSRWVVGRGTNTLVTDSSQWAGGGM